MWYETGDDNRKDTNDEYKDMDFFDSGLDITGVEKRGWFKKYWKRMWNLFPRADKEHQAKKGSKDSKLYYFDAYNTTLRNIINDSEKRKVLNDIREPNHYLGYMSLTHNDYWANDKYLVIFNWIDGPYAELEFYLINDNKHFNPKQPFYYYLAELRSQYAFTIIHGDCPIVRTLRNHNVDIYYCDVDGLADKIYDKVYNPEFIKWGYKFKGVREELNNLYPDIVPEDKNKLFENMYAMVGAITGVMKIDVIEKFVIEHMKSQFLKGRSFDELWDYFSMRTSVLEDEITEAFLAAFPELQTPKQEAIEGSNNTDSGPIAPFRPKLEKEYGLEEALPQNTTLADLVNRSKVARENIIAYELQEDNWKNTNIIFKPLKFLYHKITGVEYIKPNTLLTPHQIAILDITIDLLQLKKTALEKGPASWFQISKAELEEYSKKPNALFNFAMIQAIMNVSRTDGYQQGLEDSLIDIATEKQKVKEAEDIIEDYKEIKKDLEKKIGERDKNITQLTKENRNLKKEADKVKPLEKENKEFKQEINDLREDRRRILRDKDTNDTALANKNRDYEQLEGEKKKKDAEYITLENKYNKLDGDKNATELSLAKKNLEFDDLQEKYSNAEKRIDRLKNKKNTYKGWLSGNRTLLHNKTKDYNKLEGDYYDAQEQIANLTEVNNNLIGWLSDNATYINNVNKNYTAAQDQIDNLTRINKNLEDWLSGNTTALVEFTSSTEEQLESQKKYFLGLLTKQNMVIDFVNNSIKWTKDRWDKALAFIDEKIKSTPGNYEHALAKQAMEDFEKYNTLKKQKSEDEETIKDLIEKVDNLTTNITTLQGVIDDYKNKTETQDDEIYRLNNRIEEQKKNYKLIQEDISDIEKVNKGKDTNLNTLSERIDTQLENITSLQGQLRVANNQTNTDNYTIENLREQVEEQDEIIKDLKEQLEVSKSNTKYKIVYRTPVPTPYPNITPIYKPKPTLTPTPKPTPTQEKLVPKIKPKIELKHFRPPPRNMRTDLIGKGNNKYDYEDIYEGKRYRPHKLEQIRQDTSNASARTSPSYAFMGFNITQGSASSGESIPPPPLVVYYPITKRRKF